MVLEVNHYVSVFPQITLHFTSLWYKRCKSTVLSLSDRAANTWSIFQYSNLFSQLHS